MKDFSEVVVSVALAFCGIALCYWIMGEWLRALIEHALNGIRP